MEPDPRIQSAKAVIKLSEAEIRYLKLRISVLEALISRKQELISNG
jgi:hypothetical protein